jgi:hypothetical protein
MQRLGYCSIAVAILRWASAGDRSGHRGLEYFAERCQVAVVCGQPSGDLSDTLDRCELPAAGRKKQKSQMRSMPTQERLEQDGVMVASNVEHEDHAAASAVLPELTFVQTSEFNVLASKQRTRSFCHRDVQRICPSDLGRGSRSRKPVCRNNP